MGDLDDLNRLFDETGQAFGSLDIFVHNAASGYNRPALEQKPKGWDWTMNINARSLLFAAQRAAALMERRDGGSIVSITSPGSGRVMPDYVVVGASKAAIESLTRYLAVELSPRNIVVNAGLSRHCRNRCAQALRFAAPGRALSRKPSPPHRPGGWSRQKMWRK